MAYGEAPHIASSLFDHTGMSELGHAPSTSRRGDGAFQICGCPSWGYGKDRAEREGFLL